MSSRRPLSDTSPPAGADLLGVFGHRYALRYLGVYGLGCLFLVATNALTVWVPDLIRQVFDGLDKGMPRSEVDGLARWIAAASMVVIVVRTLSRVLFFNPGRTIEFRLRNDMLERLLRMSTSFFRRVGVGELVSRATNDATYVRAFVGFAVLNLLNLLLAGGFALREMVRTDEWLTLWCVLPLLLSTYLLHRGVRWMHQSVLQVQQAIGELSGHVLETYGAAPVLQAAVAEQGAIDAFDELNERYTSLMLKVAWMRAFLMPMSKGVGSLCLFLLLWLGGEHIVKGQLTVGQLAAYASYIWILVAALGMTGWLLNSLQRGYVSLQRLWEVLQLREDRPFGQAELVTDGQGLTLTAEALGFRYPDATADELDALSGVDLTISPGQVVGVYGPVASGKSTLAMVLAGLLPPTSGQVNVNGRPLEEYNERSLRDAVTMVPQESFLFSRSLHDNVGYHDPLDKIDRARVEASTERAALKQEIQRMPEGLETMVGERGVMLSGGQRQRTQLARALYASAKLYILDDVLSAVDHDTEARLLAELERELGGDGRASAVVISSRLSALRGADEIIVLDRGEVVERGDHEALILSGGLYAAAWEAQTQGEERAPG